MLRVPTWGYQAAPSGQRFHSETGATGCTSLGVPTLGSLGVTSWQGGGAFLGRGWVGHPRGEEGPGFSCPRPIPKACVFFAPSFVLVSLLNGCREAWLGNAWGGQCAVGTVTSHTPGHTEPGTTLHPAAIPPRDYRVNPSPVIACGGEFKASTQQGFAAPAGKSPSPGRLQVARYQLPKRPGTDSGPDGIGFTQQFGEE